MDTLPRRPTIALFYRALLSLLEKWVVLPNINPAYYQALAIGLSVLFFYTQVAWQRALIIGVVLLTDWLDGATARRYRQASKSGYISDVVIDRASEAMLFLAEAGTALGQGFFLLWMLNCALTFYSARSNKHLSLPLRFAYMVILIVQAYGAPI